MIVIIFSRSLTFHTTMKSSWETSTLFYRSAWIFCLLQFPCVLKCRTRIWMRTRMNSTMVSIPPSLFPDMESLPLTSSCSNKPNTIRQYTFSYGTFITIRSEIFFISCTFIVTSHISQLLMLKKRTINTSTHRSTFRHTPFNISIILLIIWTPITS